MNATTFSAETSRRAGSAFHLRKEIAAAASRAAKLKGRGLLDIIAADARARGGFCVVTNREIVEATGQSEDTIARTLAQLVEAGVIYVFEARTDGGRGRRRVVLIADVLDTHDGPALVPPAILEDRAAVVPVEVRGPRGRAIKVGDLRRLDYPAQMRSNTPHYPAKTGVSYARASDSGESQERGQRPADAGSPAAATLRPPRTPEAGGRNPADFAQGSRRNGDDLPPIRTSGGQSIATGAQTPRDSSAPEAGKAPAGTPKTVSATSKASESAADSRTAKAVRLVVEAHAAEYSRTFKHRRTPKGSDRGHAKTLLGAIVEAVPGVSIDRAVEIAVEAVRRCFAVRRTRERIAAGIVDPFAAVAHARSAFVSAALSVLAERARDERVKAETAERRERELEERRARMNPAAGTIDFSKTLEEIRRKDAERIERETAEEAEKAKQLDERKAALRRQLAGAAS